MKKKIVLLMCLCLAVVVGCGKEKESKVEEVSQKYQEELGLDESTADELAQVAVELEDVTEEEKETETKSTYCYDKFLDMMDEDLILADSRFLLMSEEQLVEAYGMPVKKDSEGLYWDCEEFDGCRVYIKLRFDQTNGKKVNTYSLGKTEILSIFWDNWSEIVPYEKVADWFAENGRFNDNYQETTLESYDEYAEYLGSDGRLIGIEYDDTVKIAWKLDNDGVILKCFNMSDGIVLKNNTLKRRPEYHSNMLNN